MTFLTYRLSQLNNAAIKAADVYYEDAVGLKIRELRVLRLIHAMPGCTQTELLANLELDKTLLSKNLAALEKKGLIVRQTDSRDNRRQCLFLSEKGRRSWQVAETIGNNLEQEMIAGMSAQEWIQFNELIGRARESFEAWQKNKAET